MPTVNEPRRSTADQLRRDIDRGRTGTPLAPGDVDAARRVERRGLQQPQPDAGLGDAWILVGFILALFAGVLVWFIAVA